MPPAPVGFLKLSNHFDMPSTVAQDMPCSIYCSWSFVSHLLRRCRHSATVLIQSLSHLYGMPHVVFMKSCHHFELLASERLGPCLLPQTLPQRGRPRVTHSSSTAVSLFLLDRKGLVVGCVTDLPKFDFVNATVSAQAGTVLVALVAVGANICLGIG